MKVLGILGAHKRDGITAKMLTTVLAGVPAPNETELLFLEDYDIKPDTGAPNPGLDQIEEKLLASDVWVIAAPTYIGSLAGVMKNFFDCLRQRMGRFDKTGAIHPTKFKDKHYLSITSCYTSTVENVLTGATDNTFKTIDKAMSLAGLIKVHELVLTNSFGQTELSSAKKDECTRWGAKIATKQKRDDNTVKRYIELFFMVAIMALVTMEIQRLINPTLVGGKFWLSFSTFVVIFYVLLAAILHFMTVMKHKRK
ncbi:flavodoxin family protein [Paucilactobacillus wasatchensis]|uniref:Integral membrane protein n=1 Tax=Paucilactobacillus wasatchensis TaxID=1335616 RepID=A0A0D1A4J8_9LACO|nr:flavodoxin family protein [Paucilactobacillus wasatchensis]KIS02597.1 integral membrane protein [Paucilactobacillus wasatchensis]